MLQRKLAESLTARIFLLTVLILLAAGGVTFGLIAWATPSTYTAVVNDDLARQVDALAEDLAGSALTECGPLLDRFIRSSGANVLLLDPNGQIADTGSQLAPHPLYEDQRTLAVETGASASAYRESIAYTAEDGDGHTVTVTMSQEAAVAAQVPLSDPPGLYTLHVTPRVEAENLAVRALIQMAPWLLLALLAFSLLGALAYSRYIARPVVRLSGIAERMAQLDFGWECRETRRDEIGALGRSLDQMARRLSAALTQLETANSALRGEVERERELDRQRMAFFNAASHELKTPVTILKGQLAGMLEGVGVYRDREKYLLRSLQVTGRMDHLIREMLAIARMEGGALPAKREAVELHDLLTEQLRLDGELFRQRNQTLTTTLEAGVTVTGDPSLLGRAVGNLLANASLYSPEGAAIRVWCGVLDGCPSLAVENSGVRIDEEALSHLFEPFYRGDGSRSRATGGSGLGLFLTKRILEQHGAACVIQNTEDGVEATVRFPG